MPLRILHVAAEVHPLIKTGGLADVLGSLPSAQSALGHEVAVLVPGYPPVLQGAGPLQELGRVDSNQEGSVRVLRGRLPGTSLPLLVLEAPARFDRSGNPYVDAAGHDWPDNHRRFALLGEIAARIVRQLWPVDIVHAHDWHAGLAPAYLRASGSSCASCFTIHNLAFQGLFDPTLYPETGLPESFYSLDGLEFYGRWSFMKAGLNFCDVITTVSPTYAREILQPEQGMGLDGVLRRREHDVHGILNGADYAVWNPASDRSLVSNYTLDTLAGKKENKRALQQAMSLDINDGALLFGVVSRLTEQKGLDLALTAMAPLLDKGNAQLALLGSGDAALESGFESLARRYAGRCAVKLGYDEELAHGIVGGADAIVVPSRFEPCGLTQLYGLRYGTLPLVRRTGGLADTVRGYTPARAARATGFEFRTASATALRRALQRASDVFREHDTWRRLIGNAMRCDFGWDKPARAYSELYARTLTEASP